jgi:AAA family ATP:ADP antiporter
LIDFQFKAAAKQAYPSKESLGVFFSSYYAWLSIATLVAQVVMTGRAFSAFGLFPSLLLTPAVLLTGSIAILIWPSLLGATLTRMADATLRNSIHRSGMEIIYLAIPSSKRKSVKIFLDVVVERIGDATAGFIILIYSLVYLDPYVTYVHFMCVGLIVIWMLLIPVLRRGHLEASSGALKSREAAVEQN